MCRSLPRVDRVVHALPQLQVTVISLYSGCILALMRPTPRGFKAATILESRELSMNLRVGASLPEKRSLARRPAFEHRAASPDIHLRELLRHDAKMRMAR